MAILMTAKEFIEQVKKVQKTKTVYMWGTYGQVLTNDLIDYKAKQYPSKNTPARVARHKKLVGQGYSAWDCVGLIKGILWGWEEGKSPKYKGTEVPDVGSDSMYKNYTTNQSTDFKNILPGEVVWFAGHIGVYIGEGLVIEATSRATDGFTDNVCISALGNIGKVPGYPVRSWTHHGRLKWVEHEEQPAPQPGEIVIHTVVKGDTPWKLAVQYLGDGNRYPEIMKLNGLAVNANIYVGQKLKIQLDDVIEEPCEPPELYAVLVQIIQGKEQAEEIAQEIAGLESVKASGAEVTVEYLEDEEPEPEPEPEPPVFKEYTVKVNTKNGLNVRKEPKASSKVVKVLGNGTKVVIIEEEKEGSRTWGLAKNQNGWIALDFTVKV